MRRPEPHDLPPCPTLELERDLWERGLRRVGGVDEAGRGALAGPVAAAIVILPPDPNLSQVLKGVRDSKQMTPHQREHWAEVIKRLALAWEVGFASAGEIDAIGIVPATRLAVQRALKALSQTPEHLLLDYLVLPNCPIPQSSLVKGDRRSLSVAAASILAKTARDAFMRALAEEHPGYGLAQNKGYGTRRHRDAIRRLGHSPIHRRSFSLKA
ncbi:MAG: ribonuclease HII [Anaerolineae bacterium]|nr:MAG: ribonuclease HII [Anaerolineae bacterium]